MTTVIFLRHGLTESTGRLLTGRMPGVHLDSRGLAQAADVAKRLAGIRLSAIVSSPLERCRETVQPIADQTGLPIEIEPGVIECGYGDWTGRDLRHLTKDPLWRIVQTHPSSVVFPGAEGESLRAVQYRAVDAVRAWNARLGAKAAWLCCTHADVIRLVLADALGMHLDEFQRLIIDPCSVSIVRYTTTRPFVLRVNDTGGDLASLIEPAARRRSRGSTRPRATP
ncbi:MAG: MSMEG_4193 family putative phosphomutase [Acidothermus cellulolyticus]|nr:MSMEG_4193 family putative phosphomutase [Acidothermus cellulolyticus]